MSAADVGGTLPYMAPERFAADGRLQPQTDMFSLGVLFLRLFSGQLPFEKTAPIADQIISGQYLRTAPKLLASVSLPCRKWIEACIGFAPISRPATYGVLRKLLPT
jgi:serine/threonine protein kinase